MTTVREREQGYRRQTLKGLYVRRHRCRACRVYFNARRGVRCCSKRCAALRTNASPTWKGDDVSYGGAHQRLYRARGRANQHPCKCGKQAQQWAVMRATHKAEEGPYSPDPTDYQPMCVSCHKRMDLARVS
jgi:hypothetical protein